MTTTTQTTTGATMPARTPTRPAKASARPDPKPKPSDTCRLTATIRGTAYTVRAIHPETSDVIRAWRLRKDDGSTYTVADTIDGATCDCGDQTFRHEGHDQTGCKHIRACRAMNLIDPEGDDPSTWPSWTDTHAFTIAR